MTFSGKKEFLATAEKMVGQKHGGGAKLLAEKLVYLLHDVFYCISVTSSGGRVLHGKECLGFGRKTIERF